MVCHEDKHPKAAEMGSLKDGGKHKQGAKEGSVNVVPNPLAVETDVEMAEMAEADGEESEDEELRFRCVRCKQEAHYEHSE